MDRLRKVLSTIWQNKIARIIIIGFLALIIIAFLLVALTTQQKNVSVKDNHDLSSAEKTAQTAIQEKTSGTNGNGDSIVLLNRVLKTDGQWQLIQVNYSNDRYNYGYTILKNNKVKIGPTTDIALDEMIKKGVPDSIIDYLYPDKPQWVGFEISAFDQNRDYIESAIEAWAIQQKISLNRVTRIGNIEHNVINPRELDEAEQLTISFTINDNNKEIYHLVSTYTLQTGSYTYSVTDANGAVQFTYTK